MVQERLVQMPVPVVVVVEIRIPVAASDSVSFQASVDTRRFQRR